VDSENREGNASEYKTTKETILKCIESCDNVWDKINKFDKSINK
jgi:hypothetical protein